MYLSQGSLTHHMATVTPLQVTARSMRSSTKNLLRAWAMQPGPVWILTLIRQQLLQLQRVFPPPGRPGRVKGASSGRAGAL